MDRSEIKKLREKQNEIIAEARNYTDQVKDDTPVEEQRELESKFDKAMEDVDAIEAKIDRGLKLIEAEERANREPVDPNRRPGSQDNRSSVSGSDQGDPENQQKWDAELAFRTFAAFGPDAVPQEHRSLLQPAQRGLDLGHIPAEVRALVVGTPASGGYLVPEGFSNELERFQVMFGPMLDPGVTRELVTQSGNKIPWPTVDDTGNTSALHTEGSAVTDDGGADPTFAERELDAYVYDSEIVRVSVELLQDSFNELPSLLGELLGERLGRGGNTILTTGTGTSQPHGIATAASAGVTTASATAITFDEIIDLIHSVDPAYRNGGSVRFMFNDSTLSALRKIKDGQGNYLWSAPNAQSGEPANIWGVPYTINQAMASIATGNDSVLFGDFRKYVVRKVGGISVFRFDEKYMNELEIGFMAYHRIDGELINTSAIKKLTQA